MVKTERECESRKNKNLHSFDNSPVFKQNQKKKRNSFRFVAIHPKTEQQEEAGSRPCPEAFPWCVWRCCCFFRSFLLPCRFSPDSVFFSVLISVLLHFGEWWCDVILVWRKERIWKHLTERVAAAKAKTPNREQFTGYRERASVRERERTSAWLSCVWFICNNNSYCNVKVIYF